MKKWFLLTGTLLTQILAAQYLPGYTVQPINNQDALPSKEINCIFQDSYGYIWFGTGNGLCRYDGYSIQTHKSSYQSPYLLCNNIVTALIEDHEQCLWIGTIHAINKLNLKTGEITTIQYEPLMDKRVRNFLYTGKQLWIGTDWGLYVYNFETDSYTGYFTNETDENSISGNSIRAMFQDSKKNIWIGIWGAGICRYNVSTGTFIRYAEICERNHISAIFEDREHNFWLGAWADGVYKMKNPYNPAQTTFQRYDPESSYERLIHSIIQEEDGTILLGTGLGIDIITFPLHTESYHSSDNKKILKMPNIEINYLYAGSNGIIWLATQEGGVYQLFKDKNIFNNYLFDSLGDLKQPISVNAFMEWNENELLIGIDKVGVARFNKKTGTLTPSVWDKELSKIPFPMGNITCFQLHPFTSEFFMGSEYGGLFSCIRNNNQITIARQFYKPWTSDWINGDIVRTICYDKDQNIWIGTNNGLNIFTNQGDTLIYDQTFFNIQVDIQAMIQDHQGKIWLGMGLQGIYCIEKPHDIYNLAFNVYNMENGGIPVDEIKCLYEDSRNRLWAGTKGRGLCLLNRNKNVFEQIKGISEISADAVLSITEVNHILYLGTNMGLVQYDPEREEENQIKIYTQSDGLPSNTFNQNAVMKGNDGLLYFGTPCGFVSFDPSDLDINTKKEPLVISDIRIFYQSYNHLNSEKQKQISPDYHPDFSKKIILSHNDYSFGIEFATLSYKHPDKNRYCYMLKGFDKEWHYVDANNRSAYYTNMKRGIYYFMVKGTNENSFMNEEPTILEITVLPPFYASTTAYILYFLLGLLLIIATIRFIHFRSALRIEKLEHQKTEETMQGKLRFFTNISHELLTPLTIISCSVEELQKISSNTHHGWKAIKRNIFRLNKLIEQILEFRKAENNKLILSVTYGDIARFIYTLCNDNFSYLGKEKNISLEVSCEPPQIAGWFDREKIDMIIYNLVSNAFKYNRINGRISIRIEADEQISDYEFNYVTITVGNTGEGLTASQINNLFKRFQTFRYTGREKRGNGIGLYLAQSLARLHKGIITVKSIPSEWTAFQIKLPISKDFYTTAEREEQETSGKPISVPVNEQTDIPVQKEKDFSILVAEDNKELLQSIEGLLSGYFTVFTASNGTDAFRIAKDHNPDIILSDVIMPGINGFDLCKKIKEDLSICHIPVILLTAKVSKEDQMEGFNTSADAYITKPFDFSLLKVQIDSILQNRKRWIEKYKLYGSNIEEMQVRTNPDQHFLKEAIALIEINITNINFDVKEFAAGLKISGSMLYRKLKVLIDMSPAEFIKHVRMQKARELLLENKFNISEIAYQVGFSDAKYFSSCFKKAFGMAPTDYIQFFYQQHLTKK
ncbi:MAG: response regulator [Tannerellaceae bacterium]|nr:response regulator [Tannerellaceae bacterium]